MTYIKVANLATVPSAAIAVEIATPGSAAQQAVDARVPVSSVAGLTGAVSAAHLADTLTPLLPEGLTDAGVAALASNVATATGATLNATFGRGVSVMSHGGQPLGLSFDNSDAIESAQAEALATGGYVYFPPGDWRFSRPIEYLCPIVGAGSKRVQLRPLPSFSGTFAIDLATANEMKRIEGVRISGAGIFGCMNSSDDGHGSALSIFEDIWFTDTNTSNYAVRASSSTSGVGALTGALFIRCSWSNTPHMVFTGPNQDDVTFLACRFNMLSANKPTTPSVIHRGQNIRHIGCYYHLEDTDQSTGIKEFMEIGAHVVAIDSGFFEVQGGITTTLTHLFRAQEPSVHVALSDCTFRVAGSATSSIRAILFTRVEDTTVSDDSAIALTNWRTYPGHGLTSIVEVLALSNGAGNRRAVTIDGMDGVPAIFELSSGSQGLADFAVVDGQHKGAVWAHSASSVGGSITFTERRAATALFPPSSMDPRVALPADVAVVTSAANSALYYRVRDGADITGIMLEVTTQSGNISVGVFANSGQGRAAVPTVRKATSGAVSCPAVGVQTVNLAAGVRVEPGDWIAISADNTTAAFRSGLTSEISTVLANGLGYKQATAHPLPSSAGTLTAIGGRNILLVGD